MSPQPVLWSLWHFVTSLHKALSQKIKIWLWKLGVFGIVRHPLVPNFIVMTHNSQAEMKVTIFASWVTLRKSQEHHAFSNSVMLKAAKGSSSAIWPINGSQKKGPWKWPFSVLSTFFSWIKTGNFGSPMATFWSFVLPYEISICQNCQLWQFYSHFSELGTLTANSGSHFSELWNYGHKTGNFGSHFLEAVTWP